MPRLLRCIWSSAPIRRRPKEAHAGDGTGRASSGSALIRKATGRYRWSGLSGWSRSLLGPRSPRTAPSTGGAANCPRPSADRKPICQSGRASSEGHPTCPLGHHGLIGTDVRWHSSRSWTSPQSPRLPRTCSCPKRGSCRSSAQPWTSDTPKPDWSSTPPPTSHSSAVPATRAALRGALHRRPARSPSRADCPSLPVPNARASRSLLGAATCLLRAARPRRRDASAPPTRAPGARPKRPRRRMGPRAAPIAPGRFRGPDRDDVGRPSAASTGGSHTKTSTHAALTAACSTSSATNGTCLATVIYGVLLVCAR